MLGCSENAGSGCGMRGAGCGVRGAGCGVWTAGSTKKTINVKKILAVINATYAVEKRKPEKIRLAGIRTLNSEKPVQRSNQLS